MIFHISAGKMMVMTVKHINIKKRNEIRKLKVSGDDANINVC